MEPIKVAELVKVVAGNLRTGNRKQSITGISTDSRAVCAGDLFIGIRGEKFDGNEFAAAALQNGASAALVDKNLSASNFAKDKIVIEVPDTLKALHDLARWYRQRFSIPAVAITGSCGKTTTKEILAHLLSLHYRVVRSQKSFNNAIGVPLTIFAMDRKTEVGVFELGSNAPGEIALLSDLVQPTGGIITNVYESHLQGLGSLQGVLEEKAALLEVLPPDGFAILNMDDPRLRTLGNRTSGSPVWVSCTSKEADLSASNVVFHGMGTSFCLNQKHTVTLPLLGTHNVYNALQALAACMALGLELTSVLEGLQSIPTASHRLERKQIGKLEILDDSYNSNPGSARAAIRALHGMHGNQRKVLILGDMLELGEKSAELHFEVGDSVASSNVNLFIAIGEESAQMVKGALAGGFAKDKIVYFPDTRSAVLAMPALVQDGDLLLVKGSRRLALETIVDALSDKFVSRNNAAAELRQVAVS